MELPTVDIVTLSYSDAKHFPKYIQALSGLAYPSDKLKLIIVDNGSTDGAVPLLKELLPTLPFAAELIESGANLGFAGGCNRGAFHGNGDYILFLNPDTQVDSDMVRILAERALSEPRAGLVEAAQYPHELSKWFDPMTHYTDWCSGGSVLAKREIFTSIGGFDTFFHPIYCEDVDLSWRMWLAGWRCVYEPRARVRHDSVLPDGQQKPIELSHSIKFSFAMHFKYDSWQGLAAHLIRGLRYLISPRTNELTRRAVADGLIMVARKLPYLMEHRRKSQRALKNSQERERFVFTEWYYGRWRTN
ncbi:MAG: glycosyltransferase family 2 protein [Acidobacteriota bacterium]